MAEVPKKSHFNVVPAGDWSSYMSNIYMQQKAPVLGTVEPHLIEEKAREALKDHPGMSA